MRYAGLVLVTIAYATCARAQDFASPSSSGAGALLESGIVPVASGASLEFASTRWWNLPELTTQAVATTATIRSLRLAAGVSRTGTGEIGWQSVAVALGAERGRDAVVLRALVRRDPAAPAGILPGAEIGGGARVALGDACELRLSAPQLWTRGASPPVRRPLLATVRGEAAGAAAWIALEAPRPGAAGERSLGVALRSPTAEVTAEARGAPWRGALGLTIAAAPGRIGARVEFHPELGETVQLSLTLGRRRT